VIKIGDFARLGQVTVPTLRYYDEMGLLKPVSVDPASGYRYYSITQMPRLNRILALKDLGFTLQQIESALNSALTLDQLQGMLMLKHAEVEQQLAAEQARLDRIAARLHQIEQENSMADFDVALKNVSSLLVATCTVTIPTNDQAAEYLGCAYKETFDHLNASGAKAAGPCFALWHQGSEILENEVAEAGVPIDHRIAPSEQVKVYELPSTLAASVVVQGGVEKLSQMHTALHQWMETEQYQTAGPYREIYHTAPDSEHPVMEVQYPVTKC